MPSLEVIYVEEEVPVVAAVVDPPTTAKEVVRGGNVDDASANDGGEEDSSVIEMNESKSITAASSSFSDNNVQTSSTSKKPHVVSKKQPRPNNKSKKPGALSMDRPGSKQTKLSRFFVRSNNTTTTKQQPQVQKGRTSNATAASDSTRLLSSSSSLLNTSTNVKNDKDTTTTTATNTPKDDVKKSSIATNLLSSPTSSSSSSDATTAASALPACVSLSENRKKKLRSIVLGKTENNKSSKSTKTDVAATSTVDQCRRSNNDDDGDDDPSNTLQKKVPDKDELHDTETAATTMTPNSATKSTIPAQALLTLFEQQSPNQRSSSSSSSSSSPEQITQPVPAGTQPVSSRDNSSSPPERTTTTNDKMKSVFQPFSGKENGSLRNDTAADPESMKVPNVVDVKPSDGSNKGDDADAAAGDDSSSVVIVAVVDAFSSKTTTNVPSKNSKQQTPHAMAPDEKKKASKARRRVAPTLVTAPSDVPKTTTNNNRKAPSSASGANPTVAEPSCVDKTTSSNTETHELIANEPIASEPDPRLNKLQTLRESYEARAHDLQQQQWLQVKRVDIPLPEHGTAAESTDTTLVFPDAAVPIVVAMVEGRDDPLSDLSRAVLEQLEPQFPNLTHDAVSTKVKVLATRKAYFKHPTTAGATQQINAFEDTNVEHHGWCWEVTLLDLLPKATLPQVKKVRTTRKRLASHWLAITKLVHVIDETLSATSLSNEQLEQHLTKVSTHEERVLKFEREDEKLRLVAQAKDAQKLQKEQEKEQKKALELEHKQEASRLKEAMKKQKEELKAKEEEAKRLKAKEEQAKKSRQQASFVSFFAKSRQSSLSVTPKSKVASDQQVINVDIVETEVATRKADRAAILSPTSASKASAKASDFDSDEFRLQLNKKQITQSLFSKLSDRAKQSLRRRSRPVPLCVSVTVFPETEENVAFGALPYAERQQVWITNRFRFFKFHEDVRPPYHGTWSKRSLSVSGRRPLGRDSVLDYDNDSEAEWEEEEETGEDLDAEDVDEEEEEAGEQYETDGWLDNDEVRKDTTGELVVSLVAPVNGTSLCQIPSNSLDSTAYVAGYDVDEGRSLLKSHTVLVLHEAPICLDVFPPDPRDADGEAENKKELSEQDLRTVCRFVHHSELGSKDKVVDELRSKYEAITNSRAHAVRVVESLAEKKKHPSGVYYWEVKKEVLEKLKLDDLLEAELILDNSAILEKAKIVATFVHHSTLTSKDKLVDEVRSQCAVSSRAEAQRLVDSLAEKKKLNGTVYWAIKPEAQHDLGLENLPSSPPPSAGSAEQSHVAESPTITPSSDAKKRKIPPEQESSSDSKPAKKHSVVAGSARMLAMFLKKKS